MVCHTDPPFLCSLCESVWYCGEGTSAHSGPSIGRCVQAGGLTGNPTTWYVEVLQLQGPPSRPVLASSHHVLSQAVVHV